MANQAGRTQSINWNGIVSAVLPHTLELYIFLYDELFTLNVSFIHEDVNIDP